MRLETVEIPAGDQGTFATLTMMRALVRNALRSPVILRWAHTVVDGTSDPDEQIVAIENWVRDHFEFHLDPQTVNGVKVFDLLSHPLAQAEMYLKLGKIVGDCDDAAVLTATLGRANFRPARFRVIGFQGREGPFLHVYTLLQGSQHWFSLDVTRPLDSTTPRPTRVAEVNV